jgi:hypothetical protein
VQFRNVANFIDEPGRHLCNAAVMDLVQRMQPTDSLGRCRWTSEVELVDSSNGGERAPVPPYLQAEEQQYLTACSLQY